MTGNHVATAKSISAEMEALYEWPKGSSLMLLDFAETVLWEQQMAEKNDLQQKAVAAMIDALKHLFKVEGVPQEHREIRYRADDRGMRSLNEDIQQCAGWLQVEKGRRLCSPLKPVHWIVWNLAPFFSKKANDPIAWRNLVKFLNCVSSSSRLGGNRKFVDGLRIPQGDARSVVALQAKRMEAIYKRIPIDTPRDVKIQRVINRHFRHRSDSPNKALHDRGFHTLNRLIS